MLQTSSRQFNLSDSGSVLADLFVLMSIPVSSLGESLVAEVAGKGAHSFVRAHVVHHVAQLGELLAALQALQHLVLPTCLLIQTLNFSESFSFPNRSHVALFTDFLFMAIALSSF